MFWDEAFAIAMFLINRTLSRVIGFDTPLHKLFHTTPDYSQLKVFGCACWPNINARKLAFRSTKCVLLGYNPNHKWYECLEVSLGRVYVSRDAVFDETMFPILEMHSNAGAWLKDEISLLHPMLFSTNLGCNVDITSANAIDHAHEIARSNLISSPSMDNEETNGVDTGDTWSDLTVTIADAKDPSTGSQDNSPGGNLSGADLPGSPPPTTHAIPEGSQLTCARAWGNASVPMPVGSSMAEPSNILIDSSSHVADDITHIISST
jgi:hypothetical protein